MYNKISRASGIILVVVAALFIGMLIKIPFIQYNSTEDNGLGLVFIVALFGMYGNIIVYASTVPFIVCALVFGIIMLKQKSREKLISLNKRILIATCVLLPFVAIGLTYYYLLFTIAALDVLMTIFLFAVTILYPACVVTPIVTMILLKKSPAEAPAETPVSSEDQSEQTPIAE